jgi:threonine dehydrogenase-like Zn-dependent dehydrogenase
MVAGGAFSTKPIITHRFPLSQAADAFHAASDRSSGAIKVVIEP